MIRKQIKQELGQRRWSVLKLHKESGVRYASLTDYLSEKKELSTINLEIVLKTLNLKIMKKTSGSKIPDYENLLKNFDGKNLMNFETEMEISESEFAAYLFGKLVKTASNFLQNEIKGYELNYGDIYDKFVQKVKNANGKLILDFSKSLQKRDFVRIADVYFSEIQKRAVAILLLFEYPENCDREYLETQFLAGLMSNAEF